METGQSIRDYILEKQIGIGGVGEVWIARHLRLDKTCAIKVVHHHLSQDVAFTKRFVSEATAMAKLEHPNIVSVLDFFELEGTSYLVMSYIEGGSLQHLLDLEGRLPQKRAVRIATDVLAALDHAHKHGVIHRDVKPSNILLTHEGRACLMDFGIALIAGQKRMTNFGTSVGTPEYMSPEQIQGSQIDHRADIYAVGCVLYEMLSGYTPFGNRGKEESSDYPILEGHVKNSPQPLKVLNSEIDPKIEAAVLCALEKNPDDRFDSCRAMAVALQEAATTSEASPLGPSKSVGRSRRFSGVGLVDVVLAPMARALGRFGKRLGTPAAERSTSSTAAKPLLDDLTKEIRSPLRQEVDRAPVGPQDATAVFPSMSDGAQALRQEFALTLTQSPNPTLIGQRVSLTHFPFRIGRLRSDFNVVDDPGVSKTHLAIDFESGVFTVRDTGSRNGTHINGRKIIAGEAEPLLFGDVINLSDKTAFTFVPDEFKELPDLTGKVLNHRYRLTTRLHASAKAAVYAAEDQKLPRTLAIKVFSPNLSAFPAYSEQFKREAETAVSLNHENICRVIDLEVADLEWGQNGQQKRVYYLCTELMSGGSLSDRLEKNPTVPLEDISTWLKKLGSALDYIHDNGVVHSGIKPSSVVFDDHGAPHLTDFAFASRAKDGKARVVIGAPAFLAPEQWSGRDPSHFTDQYALAALVYVLVTGVRPYEGQENPVVRKRNFARGPDPAHREAARNGREGVPAALSSVLERALSVEPDSRFPSVSEFADAFLAAISGQDQISAAPPRIFISYHRQSSAAWANYLATVLKQKHGISSFVDTERRDGAVRIPNRLQNEIAGCDVFICLLAEFTLASDWVLEEIRQAHERKKPMVPIFQESFRTDDAGSQPSPHVEALLNYDCVHIFDRRNIHIEHSVDQLAAIIRRTVESRRTGEATTE